MVIPEMIAGRYLVKELLGKGGMAVVYRVIDTHDHRELALKQMRSYDKGKSHQWVRIYLQRSFKSQDHSHRYNKNR